MLVYGFYDFGYDFIGLIWFHLAGGHNLVASAPVAQSYAAKIGSAAAVGDAVAQRQGYIAPLTAPVDLDADPGFRKHGVDQKAVAGKDFLFLPQIYDHYVAVEAGAAHNHFPKMILLAEIQEGSLQHIGHLENLFRAHGSAALYQFRHELKIGNAEIMETAQACAWIHDIAYEDPAGGILDFLCSQSSAVYFIHSVHERIPMGAEAAAATEKIIYDSGAGWRQPGHAPVGDIAQSFSLAGVVIEPHAAAWSVGHIGQNVIGADFHLSGLDIAGMGKKIRVYEFSFF